MQIGEKIDPQVPVSVWSSLVNQGSNFTKALKAIAVVHSFFCHREWDKFKLKNALTTAKKLGIAVGDLFRNSRPVNTCIRSNLRAKHTFQLYNNSSYV
jgi:hypothetical protein